MPNILELLSKYCENFHLSQDLTQGLYLVSVPIGNKFDITIRAIHTIACANILAVEDTRTFAKRFGFLCREDAKIISLNDVNEKNKCYEIINMIERGNAVAILPEAGSPILCDPGFPIVKYAIKKNIKIHALPGASAILNSLITSGFDPIPFIFLGFLRKKVSEKFILSIIQTCQTHVFFESPHRLNKTIDFIKEVCNSHNINGNICIVKDLTKDFEHIYRGELCTIDLPDTNGKGEFVVIIQGVI